MAVEGERAAAGKDEAHRRDYTAELIRLAPDLIVANSTPALAVLHAATTTIPVVFESPANLPAQAPTKFEFRHQSQDRQIARPERARESAGTLGSCDRMNDVTFEIGA
jgi:hypothetical protein